MDLNRYIVWRLVLAQPRNQKYPIDWQTGAVSDAFDSKIWCNRTEATARASALGAGHGVGYVVMPDAGEFFIDIDDCLVDGAWSPIAVDLCQRFAGAFVEVSSSGKGLHIIGKGIAPEHRCKSGVGFDLYTGYRWVGLTFDRVQGNAGTDCTTALGALVAQYLQPIASGIVDAEWGMAPVEGYGDERPDQEVIDAAMRSKSAASVFGGKASFTDLFTANAAVLGECWPDDHNARPYDASSADMALAVRLMWYCGGNSTQVHRIMLLSALRREKWEKRGDDYLTKRTIGRARSLWIAGGSKFYTGGRALAERKPMPELGQVAPDGVRMRPGEGTEYFHYGFPQADCKPNGKPKGTYSNFLRIMEKQNITIRYNAMTRIEEISIPGEEYVPDLAANCQLTTIISICVSADFPVSNVQQYVQQMAQENTYHPALNWVMSQAWDGQDRIPALVDSLDASDKSLADMLVRRWLATAVDALCCPDGINADGMLVLQGAQYGGKTTWFRMLMGDHGRSESILDAEKSDSVAQNTDRWIVELSEVERLTRRENIEATKSFITRSQDKFRPPYERKANIYSRRTVFAGTVNPVDYLRDPTGNRRFWTVACGPGLNAMHGLDAQQIWAQVMAQRTGRVERMTPEQLQRLNIANAEEFTVAQAEPIYEFLVTKYDLEAPRPRQLMLTQIIAELESMGMRIGERDRNNVKRCSEQVQKALGGKPTRNTKGSIYHMPFPTFK
jgi:hypothetical protein